MRCALVYCLVVDLTISILVSVGLLFHDVELDVVGKAAKGFPEQQCLGAEAHPPRPKWGPLPWNLKRNLDSPAPFSLWSSGSGIGEGGGAMVCRLLIWRKQKAKMWREGWGLWV